MEYVKCFDEHEEYQNYKDGPFYVGPNVSMCMDMIHTHISGKQEETNYLTFTAKQPNSTISIKFDQYPYSVFDTADTQTSINFIHSRNIKYATKKEQQWNDIAVSGQTIPTHTAADASGHQHLIFDIKEITLENIGDTVVFKGSNNGKLASGIGNATSNFMYFSMSGEIEASGDLTSLTNGVGGHDNRINAAQLFINCTALTKAPNLPSTSLQTNAYEGLFMNCTSLTTSPELPATTLSVECYQSMFKGCTSLTGTPILETVTLANCCYRYMFSGCTSLTETPYLNATTLSECCYQEMFAGCTALTMAHALPASVMKRYCYKGMFQGCTSLTTAPAFTATTMAEYACENMFSGCTSLVTVPALPATTLAKNCYSGMFSNCTSLTTAPSFFSESPKDGCFNYMFYMCTSLKNNIPSSIGNSSNSMPASACTYMFAYTAIETMPDLPSLSVGELSYGGMFYNCKSLTYAKDLPATSVGEGGYRSMFYECTSISNGAQGGGNFVEIYATTTGPYAFRNMFDGCSSLRGVKIHIDHSRVGANAMQYMFRNCTNIREIYTKLTDFPSRQTSPSQLDCKTYLWLENAGYNRSGNITDAKLYVKDNVSTKFLVNNTYRYSSSYSSGFDVIQVIW